MQNSKKFYTFAGNISCHHQAIFNGTSEFYKQMEQSIVAVIEDKLVHLPFIKAGINRLLYPKVRKNNALMGSNACFISDKDRLDDTVMSFCEYVFFHYSIFCPISGILQSAIFLEDINEGFLHFLDSVNRNFDSIKYKYFASFDDVHAFFYQTALFFRPSWLEFFGFSTKTLIEIRDLIFDDNERKVQRLQQILTTGVSFKDAMEFIDREKAFSKTSHRRFVEIINREDYPPLFFSILIYNYIDTLSYHSTLLEPVFIKKGNFSLRTWPMGYDARTKLMEKAQKVVHDDFKELFENKQYFSDCKFMGWGDDWLDQFDSSENNYRFASWIRTGGRKELYVEQQEELDEELDNSLLQFLAKRGWKIPGFDPSLVEQKINASYLKRHVETELEHLAAAYTIVRDILSEESRATINWLLERTHYNTIFNKLVEDFTTKYLDKGQEQTTLQESGSSAIETSNETEQQNIPVIVVDKDEAHKEWFVRVHEKKINAQPDEWNKKLYTCLDALYDSLVKKGLMCESSKKELFIYRFSGFNIPESFNPQEKIRWEGKNVLLGFIVRCLITYTGTDAKGLGTVATFFESKRGKDVNLATANYISKEDFNQRPNNDPNLSLAVEILKECGFEEVEATSTRKRDK